MWIKETLDLPIRGDVIELWRSKRGRCLEQTNGTGRCESIDSVRVRTSSLFLCLGSFSWAGGQLP